VHFVSAKMPSRTSSKTVRTEEARFRARLRRALVVGLAGPAATIACSTSTGSRGGHIDASVAPDGASDASVESDAGNARDGGEASFDAAPDPCAVVVLDAAAFGTDGACDNFVQLPCGIPPDAAIQGCAPAVDLCNAECPDKLFFECAYAPITCIDGGLIPDAEVVIECGLCIGNLGRRPAGLREPGTRRERSPVGDYFARAAYLEAASVDAFVHLETQLAALGAPAPLQARTARAAEDERRHARTTARIARRYGVEPEVPRVAAAAAVTLEELAHENAAEGCVRESFAALLALHQARYAADPCVAHAMRVIAREEARHATLSWSIHAWANRRLATAARARVRATAEQATARLRGAARAPRHAEVARIAGLPSVAEEAQLVESFAEAFFGSGEEKREPAGGPPGRRRRRGSASA